MPLPPSSPSSLRLSNSPLSVCAIFSVRVLVGCVLEMFVFSVLGIRPRGCCILGRLTLQNIRLPAHLVSTVGIQVSHQHSEHQESLPRVILVFEALATLFATAAAQFNDAPGSVMHQAQPRIRLSHTPGLAMHQAQ